MLLSQVLICSLGEKILVKSREVSWNFIRWGWQGWWGQYGNDMGMTFWTTQGITLRMTLGWWSISDNSDNLRFGVRNHFDVCHVTAEFKFYKTRQCYMRCKCAESANQCVLHIVSGISRKSVSICEIVKYWGLIPMRKIDLPNSVDLHDSKL